MKIRQFVLLGGLVLASAQAFAFHCPMDMKKIDEAMGKNPKLSAEQMAEVKKLRAEGETLHKAGKHQESVDTLGKAMKMLNVQ
ncbi:MAG: hypothetical protein KJZ92_13785 [Rhodocyclaceae bacterium]|jgi:hypothetical protein|nr:hypothetical protein [Rhodocyclaceae bacterium]MBZ0144778.1 hypothetical protein [Rhodocyclaceae bacterium]MCL4682345.1 hypothetical protein [Rhodocyclaceae bacterium]